ncbi:MAG: PadR family transcriptional regulator [Actinomycetota bacterium]
MSTDLSPISYAVLALVGRNGASGPELVEMATQAGPLFWTGGGSHVLRVARQLAAAGYLAARTEPAKTRPRTVFEMTPAGHAAFREWLARPSTYPRIQHEAAIRLFASDLGDGDAVLASLRALREELPALEAVCDMFEERARGIPHRTRAIVLELSLARRLVQAHREWIDEVEAELSSPDARGPAPRHPPDAPG